MLKVAQVVVNVTTASVLLVSGKWLFAPCHVTNMSTDEWRRVVQPILSTVLDKLTLSPSLETQLLEKDLINYVDLQSVKAKPTDYERKTELLYKYLWTRGPNSLQQFCRALKDAGNRHLAKLLKDRIRKPETEPPSSLGQRQSSRQSYYSDDGT